jgi:TolB-like protein/Tfp pilus assembly protein PilF
MSFLGEVKRRKIFQVAAVYGVTAWLIVQITSTIEEPLQLPTWFDTAIIVLVAIGFPITVIISWAFNLTPDGLARDTGGATVARGRGIEYALLGLLAVAVGWTFYRVEFAESRTPTGSRQGVTDELALPNSVAVLPLENLSPDPNDAAYARGMHAEIINQLSKLSHLNVINGYSALQYAASAAPIENIARDLRVGAVLLGSFQYVNGRIRVVLSLIDPATRTTLLPLEYERDFSDIFAVQSDIAMSVANALNTEFSDAESQLLETAPTRSPDAYGYFVRARGHAVNNSSEPELRAAIDAFETAIDLDPTFGEAYVGLAAAYQMLATMIPGREAEALRLREAAILRATEVGPDLVATQLLLAAQYVDLWQWANAERAFRKALELSPGDFDANENYGDFLFLVGRASESLPYKLRAQQKDPLLLDLAHNIAIVHDTLGNVSEALEIYERNRSLPGDHLVPNAWQRFRLLAAGEIDAAIAHGKATDASPGQDVWSERVLFALPQGRDASLAILREAYADPANQTFNLKGQIAHWAAYLGDPDLAIQALRDSVAVDDWWIRWMWDSFAEPVHATPQFKEFMADLGLPEYWREAGWPDHCRPLGATDFECF